MDFPACDVCKRPLHRLEPFIHHPAGRQLHDLAVLHDAAVEHLRQALSLAVEVGLPWTVMLAARSMARVIVDADAEMAARLLGNTEAISALFGYLATPDERELVDTTLAAATDKIGTDAVAAAMTAGSMLSYTELPALFAS